MKSHSGYCRRCGRNACECVPCETCGELTAMTGTKRCDGCWEIERRLRDYLRSDGGREFVAAALEAARTQP
jgi:hypothetical protein